MSRCVTFVRGGNGMYVYACVAVLRCVGWVLVCVRTCVREVCVHGRYVCDFVSVIRAV